MSHPSPYDLIQKATRSATATDRWAALQASAKARVSVGTQQGQAGISQSAAFPGQGAEYIPAQSAPPAPSRPPQSHPELIDPPFAPPQPRHSSLDDIAQRHEQAKKAAAAMPTDEREKPARQSKAPSAPLQAPAPKKENEQD